MPAEPAPWKGSASAIAGSCLTDKKKASRSCMSCRSWALVRRGLRLTLSGSESSASLAHALARAGVLGCFASSAF